MTCPPLTRGRSEPSYWKTYTGGSADSRSLQTTGRNVQASLGSTRWTQLGTAPCTSRVSTHCSSANPNLPSVNDGICLACNNLLTNQFGTASCGDRFELRRGQQLVGSTRRPTHRCHCTSAALCPVTSRAGGCGSPRTRRPGTADVALPTEFDELAVLESVEAPDWRLLSGCAAIGLT